MIEIPGYIWTIVELLLTKGNQVYAVGGCIRDSLLGNQPKDIDLTTDVLPNQMLALDRGFRNGYSISVLPVGIEFGTVVFVLQENNNNYRVEVTTMRQDIQCDGRHAKVAFTTDILKDLARRDFTINAMAIQLYANHTQGPIISVPDSLQDTNKETIRAVGLPERRFREDYLRMIRACRFVGYFKDGIIDPVTKDAIKKLSRNIKKVSKERIRDEIKKMMLTCKPSRCIEALRQTGLLRKILPIVADCIGINQNQYHDEQVYDHLLACCDAIPKNRPLLRLAALLHDVGKPITKAGKGKHSTFYNHEVVGAEIAYNWAKQYKFSAKDCEYLSKIVRFHMFHMDYDTKRKTIKRWLAKLNGLFYDIFMLRIADRMGNKAKKGRRLITSYMKRLLQQVKEIKEYKEPLGVNDLAISGKTLLEMGYSPGPLFGKVLHKLLEEVLDDPTKNNADQLKQLATAAMEKYQKSADST